MRGTKPCGHYEGTHCRHDAPVAKRIEVKRQGKQWAVYRDGALIEGGFFDREVAEAAAREYAPK